MSNRRHFSGLPDVLPAIGQGTWQMEGDDRASCVRALRRGLDLGLRHIDTAELYGRGRVEEIVAEAIEGRRDQVFLVNKVLPNHASYEGTLRACEQSLRRLRTDRLDGYLLHWPGSEPLRETIRAFQTLKREGKIRSFGVSNFDVHELEEAERLAGKGAIACNQVLYHLLERGIEHAVLPWCESHDVPVVAYSPFGSGRFPSSSSASGKVLESIAKTHGATARQVALAFLVRRPSLLTIPKASKVPHVEECAGALELQLEDDAIARIDAAFPRGPKPRELPTL